MSQQRQTPAGEGSSSFQGWQRGACLIGVAVICLLALFLCVSAVLGLAGIH